jgi:hypothetical protein
MSSTAQQTGLAQAPAGGGPSSSVPAHGAAPGVAATSQSLRGAAQLTALSACRHEHAGTWGTCAAGKTRTCHARQNDAAGRGVAVGELLGNQHAAAAGQGNAATRRRRRLRCGRGDCCCCCCRRVGGAVHCCLAAGGAGCGRCAGGLRAGQCSSQADEWQVVGHACHSKAEFWSIPAAD